MTDRLDRFLDGELDEREREALARDLRSREQAQALLRRAADDWGLCQALRGQETEAAAGSGQRPVRSPARPTRPTRRPAPRSRRRSRRPGRSWLAVVPVVALVLLLIGGWLVFRQGAAPAPVVAQPTVTASSGTIPADFSAALRDGRATRLPSGVRCTVRLPDGGSDLHLQGPVELQLHGPRTVWLGQGVCTAAVVPQEPDTQWTLETPHASCAVIGTRFTVEVVGEATTLAVTDGQVVFRDRRDGSETVVAAGQTAEAVAVRKPDPPAPPAMPPGPLLHYDFDHITPDQVGCRAGQVPCPPFVDESDRPLRSQDGGLLVTMEDNVMTPTNQPQPELADRLRRAEAITLAVRTRCLAVPSKYLLLAELHMKLRSAEDGDPTAQLCQVRWAGPPDTEEHVFALIQHRDGQRILYRDGVEFQRSEAEVALGDVSDIIQLKLLMPALHHDGPKDFAGVVFDDLWLYDRAVDPADFGP